MLQGFSYGTMEVNMGGRGATSNLARLAKYGTEFRQVKTNKNGKRLHMSDKRVLFVESIGKHAKTPYESMMPHRIYVQMKKRSYGIKSITFTDKMGFAYKFIDVKTAHHNIGKGKLGHTHMGYYRKSPREMNHSERRFLKKVMKAVYVPKYKKRKGGITKWLHLMKNFPHGKI